MTGGLSGLAAALTVVLVVLINDRVQIWRTGEEIVLETQPIDPRSLFRGYYVRLGYAINPVPLPPALAEKAEHGDTLYVHLYEDDDGLWRPAKVSADPEETRDSGVVVLRGEINHMAPRLRPVTATETLEPEPTPSAVLDFGLGRYYADQETAKALEIEQRETGLEVIVVVDRNGRGAIRGLVVDGDAVRDRLF